MVAAGRIEIQSQERFIASALTQAYRVELGGQLGRERGWGVALAVRIDDAMSRHRSKLGNDLASLAQQQVASNNASERQIVTVAKTRKA